MTRLVDDSDFAKIETGIKRGVYRTIRLICDDGKDSIIVPFNRMNDQVQTDEHTAKVLDRLKGIIFRLTEKSEVGKYIVQCRSTYNKSGICDNYKFEVVEDKPIQVIPIKKDNDDETEFANYTQMESIELKDYLKLVKECEEAKARCAVLQTELEMYKSGMMNKSLSDESSVVKTTSDKLFELAENSLPSIVNLFDKILAQRDKQLDLKERELSMGFSPKRKAGVNSGLEKINLFNSETKRIANLFSMNEEQANDALDVIQESNPELYNYIVKKLGIEEGDSSEDQTEVA